MKYCRLAVFATHPVQYHVPLWRRLAKEPGLEIKVFYFSDHCLRGAVDPGFGRAVAWDLPLLSGYESHFVTRDADLEAPSSVRVTDPVRILDPFNAVLLLGYSHGFERQVLAAAAAQGKRVILRAELADHGRRPLWKALARWVFLKWFYSKVDAFAVIGEAARRHLAAFGIPMERQFPSPYAIDEEVMEPQRMAWTRELARESLGISQDAFVVVFSGKLIQRKDPLSLIRAMGRCPAGDKGVLLIAGDGPLRSELERQGRALLGDRLVVAGFINQSQLGKYYMASDVLVLPSQFETWGLVVNEAMYFGLPVIVTDQVGSHHDLVIPGNTGYVCAANDSDALFQHLCVLYRSAEHRAQLGLGARERVALYSTERAAQGLLAALDPTLQVPGIVVGDGDSHVH